MRNQIILVTCFGVGTLIGLSSPISSGTQPVYALAQTAVKRMINEKGTLVIKRVAPAVTLLLHHREPVTEETSEVYLPIIEK